MIGFLYAVNIWKNDFPKNILNKTNDQTLFKKPMTSTILKEKLTKAFYVKFQGIVTATDLPDLDSSC